MTDSDGSAMRGELVEESVQLTLVQLCHACDAEPDAVAELVAHGVLEPQGGDSRDWRFGGDSLRRSRVALRLIRDLGVNVAGAALALELIARIDQLQALLDSVQVDQRPAR